jgi:hypothetical protein
MSFEPEYIGIDDSFTFNCHTGVSCFNQCCSDVNQFLYPYDIIRLKSHLGISSTDFLEKYTVTYSGDTTGLPIVAFKTRAVEGNICPFVTEKGCGVYENRPASCRLFPLARAISRSRQTGTVTEHFAIIKDPICMGFDSGRSIRVRDWLINQGLHEYNQANDRMIELISLKQQIMPGPLTGDQKEKFILACYDVDRFRMSIKNDGLINENDIEKGLYHQIMANDVDLLDFGLTWITKELFGNKAC